MNELRTMLGVALLALSGVAVADEPEDPAETPAPSADEPVGEEALMPEERAALHTPAAKLREWAPEDEDIAALLDQYAAFVDAAPTGDPDEDVKLITEIKGPELASLDESARAIMGETGKPVLATAFVLANALLFYADLAYELKPTDEMTEKDKKRLTRMLERDVRPLMVPVDVEARQWLESVVGSSEDGSDWNARAKDLLTKMDAAGRGMAPE